jgi:hypothetical protein
MVFRADITFSDVVHMVSTSLGFPLHPPRHSSIPVTRKTNEFCLKQGS